VKRCRLALASAAVWATVAATPAGAVDKVVEVASNGPGPKAYDRVFVHEMGPRDADSVLVLMPGTQGGAGDLTLIAEELIKRVDDLQVWAAYAAWDFHGRPGYRDLGGLVLIDGGLLGSFDAYDLGQAQQQIAELENSNPFLDLLGTGIPEAAGLFAEIGGIYGRLEPTAAATTLQEYPLLPEEFKPPFPVTTRALFGYAFDRDTSPPELGLLHVNAGGLAASGDPRDWHDGGVTPVARLAATFGQEPSNAVEWYFPKRLTIDTNGADRMRMNDVARFLGLRLEHTREIDVPIYAIQTDLTDGDVLRGARRLVKLARTRPAAAELVDADPQQSHLDPLTAAPKRNMFVSTVAPFIERIGR
jgi:hypothetical protein